MRWFFPGFFVRRGVVDNSSCTQKIIIDSFRSRFEFESLLVWFFGFEKRSRIGWLSQREMVNLNCLITFAHTTSAIERSQLFYYYGHSAWTVADS